jgi:hypothetical protein
VNLEAAKKALKQKEQKLLEAVAESESAEKEAVELEARIKTATKGLKGEGSDFILPDCNNFVGDYSDSPEINHSLR